MSVVGCCDQVIFGTDTTHTPLCAIYHTHVCVLCRQIADKRPQPKLAHRLCEKKRLSVGARAR